MLLRTSEMDDPIVSRAGGVLDLIERFHQPEGLDETARAEGGPVPQSEAGLARRISSIVCRNPVPYRNLQERDDLEEQQRRSRQNTFHIRRVPVPSHLLQPEDWDEYPSMFANAGSTPTSPVSDQSLERYFDCPEDIGYETVCNSEVALVSSAILPIPSDPEGTGHGPAEDAAEPEVHKDGGSGKHDDLNIHLPPVLEPFESQLKYDSSHETLPCSPTINVDGNGLLKEKNTGPWSLYSVRRPSLLRYSVLLSELHEEDEKEETNKAIQEVEALNGDDTEVPPPLPPKDGPRPNLQEPALSMPLSAKLQKLWLIQADIDRLIADGDIEALNEALRGQMNLAAKYRAMKVRSDTYSSDPRALIPWYQLLAIIGNKMALRILQGSHWQLASPQTDIAVQRAQAELIGKIQDGIAGIAGVERTASSPNPTKAVDCRESSTWELKLAELPYGPTIDDSGQPVTHYWLCRSNNVIDPHAWSVTDLRTIRQNGFGGFIGLSGHPAVGPDVGRGYSGAPGVQEIEMAIRTRFDTRTYSVCWLIEPGCGWEGQSPCRVSLWVVQKKPPGLLSLLRIRRYMKLLNVIGK